MRCSNYIIFLLIFGSLAVMGCEKDTGDDDDATSPTGSEPTPTEVPATPTATPIDQTTPTPVDQTTPTPTVEVTPTPMAATPTPTAATPTPEAGPDNDGDGYAASDCDDTNADIHPNATEIPYDGIDQDCSGGDLVDQDFDGYEGGENGDDCNDLDSEVRPGLTETCDDVDHNCDGDNFDGLSVSDYYQDMDGDGYGTDADTMSYCKQPDGYAANMDDCNDKMWSVNPDATEICNGLDDDCDGLVDSADAWGDNSMDLETLNSGCDSWDKLMAGEIELLVSDYTVGGSPQQDVFPNTRVVGVHAVSEATPADWPQTCIYLEQSYFVGSNSDGDTETRPIKLCFSRGTGTDGIDEVYAEMTVKVGPKTVTQAGVLNNDEDDDEGDLDSVYYDADESAALSGDGRYEVWYVSDSFYSESDDFTSTMSIHNARFVIDTTPNI